MKHTWRLWRLRVEWFKSEMNWHGPRIGPTEFQTLRRGGRIVNLHIANKNRGYFGYRFIRYAADGSWRCLDLFWMRYGDR